jgi:hypothetical protein
MTMNKVARPSMADQRMEDVDGGSKQVTDVVEDAVVIGAVQSRAVTNQDDQ